MSPATKLVVVLGDSSGSFVAPFDRPTGHGVLQRGDDGVAGRDLRERPRLLQRHASPSGRNPGANECVHVSLVNPHPPDPANAEPAADHGRFDGAHPIEVVDLTKMAVEAGVTT
jgi:hypothetical protein